VKIIREAAWVLAVGVLTFLLAGQLLGFGTLRHPTLDVQLHNTYFIVPMMAVLSVVFLGLLLLALGLRSLFRRARTAGHLWFVIISSSLLIVGASWAGAWLSSFSIFAQAFPAYSPTATLNAEPAPLPLVQRLIPIGYVVQGLALASLTWASYCLGCQRKAADD